MKANSILNSIRELVPIQQKGKLSYSQCGEDIIVDFLRQQIGLTSFFYLDIGANDASHLNNTFYFYVNKNSGVCVEPDPVLFRDLQKRRRRDLCLNVGIGTNENTVSDFYVMSERTLNTFSKDTAHRIADEGFIRIEDVVQIPLITFDQLVSDLDQTPNFVSLDVEGLEFEILNSINFQKYRPEIFCIETLTFSQKEKGRKIDEVITYMKDNGYLLYADTYINSIFVDDQVF